jgi:hypothetical protein
MNAYFANDQIFIAGTPLLVPGDLNTSRLRIFLGSVRTTNPALARTREARR